MSWTGLSDGIMNLLEKTLTWRTKNQEVISGNIANLDTPGYRSKEMDFQSILDNYTHGNLQEISLKSTAPGHMTGGDPEKGLVTETDGETDLEHELVQMTQNQVAYNASIQMLIKKLEFLRNTIDGGGK